MLRIDGMIIIYPWTIFLTDYFHAEISHGQMCVIKFASLIIMQGVIRAELSVKKCTFQTSKISSAFIMSADEMRESS